ncbi:uncharacterized protein BJX67DRAFT_367721 [Aspergillus lucknowensis]|uniref:Uncharacterized protein n=1 Tax=Aspergillus lucknowensis TaxID=176173 RepID=A0ABR4L8N5_9EURO
MVDHHVKAAITIGSVDTKLVSIYEIVWAGAGCAAIFRTGLGMLSEIKREVVSERSYI